MTEPRNDDRAQARREAATLLGVDIEHLTAADSLRVDMVSALRLVIDSEQASILSGGSADLGKLNVAVQSLIALLPNRELPESAASRADPRAHMWAVYSEMRRRGADVGQGYDGALKRIAALEAEIAALKAVAPETNWRAAPDEPGASGSGSTAAITPPTCDIVPPGERAECDPGMRPGPDDPRPPVVIEAKANPPQPPARKPFVNGLSDVPQHVRDTRPPNEAWRNFVKIDWQG